MKERQRTRTNGFLTYFTAELGEYLGQIKSYAEALEVMDDEHDDTLLANCMDVHSGKQTKDKNLSPKFLNHCFKVK